jgi:CheY-like chemotaxis protein
MSSTDFDQLTRANRAIAHDLRNVFSVVNACAADLYDEMHGRQAATLVLEILNAAERGLLAATELLQAAQAEPGSAPPLDLVRQVHELWPILQRVAPPEIVLEVVPSVSAAWAAVDRTSLLQILMNLVANASDASGAGGPIRVIVSRTRRTVERGRGIEVASLLVSDEGSGIDSDVLDRVFDEGFSTKAGLHWGLGLAVVRRVVERCGGWIDVRSVPGHGTTVEAQFPLAEPDQTGVAVVVVRDDLRRLWLADALASFGAVVVAAPDALEACDLMGGGRIPDIALLDQSAASDRGLREVARLDQAHHLIVLQVGEPSSLDDGHAIVQRCAEALASLRISR